MTVTSLPQLTLNAYASFRAVCRDAISYVGTQLGLVSKVSNCWIERNPPTPTTRTSTEELSQRFVGIKAESPSRGVEMKPYTRPAPSVPSLPSVGSSITKAKVSTDGKAGKPQKRQAPPIPGYPTVDQAKRMRPAPLAPFSTFGSPPMKTNKIPSEGPSLTQGPGGQFSEFVPISLGGVKGISDEVKGIDEYTPKTRFVTKTIEEFKMPQWYIAVR
ncbi:MAG: hypothetical protein JWP38_721 [Herbaspirillum sp.]|nr:hypothetical protein [Herbaspirillum sp.]